MKSTKLFIFIFIFSYSKYANAQSLLHYWNFNDISSFANHIGPTSSIGGGKLDTLRFSGGTSLLDHANGTNTDLNLNLNARNGDVSSTHLRFNNPIYGALIFSLPTTGYKDIEVKYASARSGSGAYLQFVHYTTDGTNYILYDTMRPNTSSGQQIFTIDLKSVNAVNNNANFKIRITFGQGGGGLAGNNRIDNFTLDAVSLSGGDVTAPTAVFLPSKNSIDVSVNTAPTITFNESIRLINNNAITANHLDTIIILKKDNANGALVTFTSSITGNVVRITPSINLDNNQNYYLYIRPNLIEDLSNNKIADTLFSNFKTISVQTIFNAGDLVPIAYRMNAISTEDEIAFLSLVNILPGTIINLTDAKNTTNVPAQCAGGFVWTAPQSGVATGSVISIQTSAGVANIGTVSGSTFGLSSGGDQVIVYTGTNTSPNFIAALSSNIWDANNIVCSGSISKLPNGLIDGTSSINLSSASGNVLGNTANAFYQGPQNLPLSQIRDSILNISYWTTAASGTAPQTWPSWAFDGPPVVESAKVLSSNAIQIIFNKDLNNASATNLLNYTGVANLNSAIRTNNGALKDTVILNFSSNFTSGNSYSITIANVLANDLKMMFSPYVFNFTYNTTLKLQKSFVVVNENIGTLNFVLDVENPATGSVNLVVKSAPFSTALAGTDFTLGSQTINFTGSSNLINISIPINNDLLEEQDEYFVLEFINPIGSQISGATFATIYIKDNDKKAPIASKDLELIYKKSFDPSATSSTCEIVVYDSASKQLFATSSIENRFDIINFANPISPVTSKSVSMTTYGNITSIAVKNGILAVASPNPATELNGKVVFFNTNGDFIKEVTVGNLPDMITFTPDGKYVMTANEGQPTVNYSADPEGSVSIIDISGGVANLTQSNVTTLLLTQFNAQESALIAAGVRKTQKTSTLSQDLEPEYITIGSDSKKAWVVCQENNAIVEIDLSTKTYSSIWALGTKDWTVSGNGFDASDNNQNILLSQWPVKSFYMPDGIASFKKDGINYIVTANEGDEKEYIGLIERATVGATTYKLDSAKFPHAAMLKLSHNLGRFRVSNLNGDTDGDGDFDEIFSVGTRSFSIFNADNRTVVYDSKDDFEQITSKDTNFAKVFNADNGVNGAKIRSRAKGPEPEGVVLATINNKMYSFIGLERTGGVMVYDITNPLTPKYVDYKNPRNQSSFSGDNGPEGIIFISNKQSPDGKHYIVVANENSGTLGIYEVKVNTPIVGINNLSLKNEIVIYPNPNKDRNIFFSETASGEILNILGNKVLEFQDAKTLNLVDFNSGLYFVKLNNGQLLKLIVE